MQYTNLLAARPRGIDVGECRYCHARIAWARNEDSGNRMPLDPLHADRDGNIILTRGQDCRVLTINEVWIWKVDHADTARYTSHHATCPHAQRAREDKRRRDARRRAAEVPAAAPKAADPPNPPTLF